MAFKHYNHLNVPDSWERYFTKYPQGMSILEALFEWVSQVDSMVDNQNNLNDNVAQFRNEIDAFIGRFDGRLQTEVTQTLNDWQESGFLNIIINEALQLQLDDYIVTNEADKLSLTAQLQQNMQQVNTLQTVKADKTEVNAVDLRIDNLVIPISAENTNIEVTDARNSVVKNKTFPSLKDRLEESESELKNSTKRKINLNDYTPQLGSLYNGLTDMNVTTVGNIRYSIFAPKGTTIESLTTNKYKVYKYDERGNWLGSSNPPFTTEKTTITEDCYIRIAALKPDESNVSLDYEAVVNTIGVYVPHNQETAIKRFNTFEWRNGSILPNGIDDDNPETRIKTTDYLLFGKGSKIYLKSPVDTRYSVTLWDKNKNFVSNTGWLVKEITELEEDCYVRIVLSKSKDGAFTIDEYEDYSKNVAYELVPPFDYFYDNDNDTLKKVPKTHFVDEIQNTIVSLSENINEKSLVLGLVTDTHTDDSAKKFLSDTVDNMWFVQEEIPFDAVFHLGDMVNGSGEKNAELGYINDVRTLMAKTNSNNYFVFGNHDDISYGEHFATGDYLTKGESYALTHRTTDKNTNRDGHNLYYYIDYPTMGVRIIVLDSVSSANGVGFSGAASWGYSLEQITWLQDKALDTDSHVLVLTHMPTPATMNYNNVGANNGGLVLDALETWQNESRRVIAIISGHTHCDLLDTTTNSFAQIGIGINFPTITSLIPPGGKSPVRSVNTVTQDLWEAAVIKLESKELRLIRFGAGEDRVISFA